MSIMDKKKKKSLIMCNDINVKKYINNICRDTCTYKINKLIKSYHKVNNKFFIFCVCAI